MAEKKPQESKVMTLVNMAGSCIMLNMVFLVCCIPVVTFGPACSGLYSGVRYMIRGDGAFQGFKEGFLHNFLRCTIAGVVSLLVIFYLAVKFDSAIAVFTEYGEYWDMIVVGLLALPALLVVSALWPLHVYIPYQLGDWLRNSVNLALRRPHYMLISAAIFWCPVVIFLWFTDLFWRSWVIFLGASFALSAFITTLLLKDEMILMLYEYREGKPFDPNDDDL